MHRLTLRTGLMAAACAAAASGQPCEPHWSDVFPLVELDDGVRTLAVLDTGDGPALYAGGDFQTDGFQNIRGLARWTGSAWQATRDNSEQWQRCRAATVHDEGNGSALYAVTWFGPAEKGYWAVGRFDGDSWTPLANTLQGIYSDAEVAALQWFDDGTGPALYAGGTFDSIDGAPAYRVARWDGQSWSEVGGGLVDGDIGAGVMALHVHDDGTGPALYVGGLFDGAGNVESPGIIRWDGKAWSSVGGGLSGFRGVCAALETFDDGAGRDLFVGGLFTRAGDLDASCIARWNGDAWATAGEFHGIAYGNRLVRCLKAVDLGGGPRLYAGGSFDNDKYTDHRVRGLAVWEPGDQAWKSAAPGVSNAFNGFVDAIAVLPEHGRRVMYVGGDIGTMYGLPTRYMARFDGQVWSRVGTGVDGEVRTLAAFDPGDGLRVYAAGTVRAVGDLVTAGIASWDERHGWQTVGGGAIKGIDVEYQPAVHSVAVSAATGRPLLFAAGGFAQIGELATPKSFAAWDGEHWFMPPGMEPFGKLFAVVGLDSPVTGAALYAAGYFEPQGPVAWARWAGGQWHVIPGSTGSIEALAFYDDGSGPQLYAAGRATALIDGHPEIRAVARWDGAEWHDVGTPLNAHSIRALQVYDAGAGPLLFAAGQMSKVQFYSAFEQIAAWNGKEWLDVAGGLSTFSPYQLLGTRDLAVADDGFGVSLFACGLFELAGGSPALQAAKWNGVKWSPLGDGIGPRIPYSPSAVAALDDPESPSVFFGGDFLTAGGLSSGRVARWVGCPPCKADCTGDRGLDVLDFLCFQARFAAGDAGADCDGSGLLDLFDFLCFVNAFNDGC